MPAPDQRYLSTDPNAGEAPQTGDRRYLSTDPNAGSAAPETDTGEPKTLGGFLGNAASSAATFAGNTVRGLSLLGRASNAALTGGLTADPELRGMLQAVPGSGPAMLRSAKDYFANRYGGTQQIADTLYTDPVGAAADASVALSLGGTALEAVPGRVGQAGRVMSAAGAATDPIAVAARTAGRVIPRATEAAAGAVAPGRVIAEQGDLFGAPSVITQPKAPTMLGRTLRTVAASGAGHYLGDPTGGIGSAIAMQALESPAVRASLARGVQSSGRVLTRGAQVADANSELLTRLAILSALQGEGQ